MSWWRSAWESASSNPREDMRGSREVMERLRRVAAAFSWEEGEEEYRVSAR